MLPLSPRPRPRPRPDGLPSSPRSSKVVHPLPSNPPLRPASTSRLHSEMSSRPQHRQPPHLPRLAASSKASHYSARQNNGFRPREGTQIRTSSNPPTRGRNERRSWAQARTSYGSASLPPSPLRETHQSRPAFPGEPSGDGGTVWSTVTNAASALTISVSKAWNAQVGNDSGEDTPPGQESRLTRAMKAYHIARARNPSDLPDWLFNDRERSFTDGSKQVDPHVHQQIDFLSPRGPTSDISYGGRQASASTTFPYRPEPRGVDRLKAMRNTARSTPAQQKRDSIRSDGWHPSNSGDGTRRPRIGLPSHPPRGRR